MTQTQQHNVPFLRFPGFSGEFIQSDLASITKKKISYGIVQAGPNIPHGMPYIKSKDLNDPLGIDRLDRTSKEIAIKYKRSEVEPGDIVFSLRGNIGVSQIVPASILVANLTQGTARISVGEAFSNRYIQKVLQTTDVVKRVFAVSKGSTFQEISLFDLRKISVFHPALPEQQKIASFLSSVEVKIEQLGKKKSLLEQYKKGMMQKLFSQELRFKNTQGNDFPDWEVKYLGDIANVYQPETLSRSQLDSNGEYFVYGANGIIGRLNRFNHEEAQVAITCRGNTCGQVTFTKPKSWITGNSMVVNLDNSESALKKYLYYDFKGTDWRYLITGSGQPQITGEIKKHRIKLPSRLEQQKIADFLSSIDQKVDLASIALNHAKTFKKGLLQQMFI